MLPSLIFFINIRVFIYLLLILPQRIITDFISFKKLLEPSFAISIISYHFFDVFVDFLEIYYQLTYILKKFRLLIIESHVNFDQNFTIFIIIILYFHKGLLSLINSQ